MTEQSQDRQTGCVIESLTIEHFRGINYLTWNPGPGVNVILGGGDVGKTTILDAIALLLSPTNTTVITDSDYWQREKDTEFSIEAVMSLPETVHISEQSRMTWPWGWDGEKAILPPIDADTAQPKAEAAVYRFRVRGTTDLELEWEVLQPDDTVDRFHVGLRRAIGLVWLLGGDRNDRDLRLVHGSALDRLLSDKGLKSRIGRQLGTESIQDHLGDDGTAALGELNTSFKDHDLPSQLGLGLAGSPGFSVNALIGLTAVKDQVQLPLTSWGAGTRRLASLAVASFSQKARPITLIDELERGLEPYRQRAFMGTLSQGGSQVFVTTHSAAALRATEGAALWHLGTSGVIGLLPTAKVGRHLRRDPEAFLARLSVVAEGITEVGFASYLLEKALSKPPLEFGVWVSDAGGHDSALDLLEALAQGGLLFAGLVDQEGRNPGRWEKLKKKMGARLLQWKQGSLEAVIVSLVDETRLAELITDPQDELTGERLRTLAERLDLDDKSFEAIRQKAGAGLKQVIVAAATGQVPEGKRGAGRDVINPYKGHAKKWFKSEEGGRELAAKVFSLGVWPELKAQVLPFLNAIRVAIGLNPLSSLPS